MATWFFLDVFSRLDFQSSNHLLSIRKLFVFDFQLYFLLWMGKRIMPSMLLKYGESISFPFSNWEYIWEIDKIRRSSYLIKGSRWPFNLPGWSCSTLHRRVSHHVAAGAHTHQQEPREKNYISYSFYSTKAFSQWVFDHNLNWNTASNQVVFLGQWRDEESRGTGSATQAKILIKDIF